jgi:hypothetical protein
LGERQWAEHSLQGEVVFRSLAYFRDFEDPVRKQAIGDRCEGTQAGMLKAGIIVTDHSTGKVLSKFVEPFEFNAQVNAEAIFVFCVSNSFNEVLRREFGATACIEILNKREFFARLDSAPPAGAKLVSGPVRYDEYAAEAHLKTLIAQPSPQDIVRSKIDYFSYQDEYRFAFSTGDALNDGQSRLCLRAFKPWRSPAQHHSNVLHLGDLTDFCRLHDWPTSSPTAAS